MTPKLHPYGPGVTLDAAGPTRDRKFCVTPTDDARIEAIKRARSCSASSAVRHALALAAERLANTRKKNRRRA